MRVIGKIEGGFKVEALGHPFEVIVEGKRFVIRHLEGECLLPRAGAEAAFHVVERFLKSRAAEIAAAVH